VPGLQKRCNDCCHLCRPISLEIRASNSTQTHLPTAVYSGVETIRIQGGLQAQGFGIRDPT
jgi:hypothetical protein